MQVLTRASRGCVVYRCQNKNPIEKLTSGCEWRHAPEARARRIWGYLKKLVSGVEFSLGRRRLAFTCSPKPDEFALYGRRTRWVGGRWKSQNRKNVYRSPYVEESLNLKVIKSFVPELRSRKCFSCFEIPMFYVYMLWTFHVHFTHRRIWLWYTHTHIYVYREKERFRWLVVLFYGVSTFLGHLMPN